MNSAQNIRQLRAQLIELRDRPENDGWQRLKPLWFEVEPSADHFELQRLLGLVAWEFAALDAEVASEAQKMIGDPAIAEKTQYRIHYARQQLALSKIEIDPQEALRIGGGLPEQFSLEIYYAVAVRLYKEFPDTALDLYGQHLCQNRYHALRFIEAIIPFDWRKALDLAQEYEVEDRDGIVAKIVEHVAADDVSQAERLTQTIEDARSRAWALGEVVKNKPIPDAQGCLAALSSPGYDSLRPILFDRYERILRDWCGVPFHPGRRVWEEVPEFVKGDDYWAVHREITYRVEADPAGAFERLRQIPDPLWRHNIFESARVEFLRMR